MCWVFRGNALACVPVALVIERRDAAIRAVPTNGAIHRVIAVRLIEVQLLDRVEVLHHQLAAECVGDLLPAGLGVDDPDHVSGDDLDASLRFWRCGWLLAERGQLRPALMFFEPLVIVRRPLSHIGRHAMREVGRLLGGLTAA